MSDLSKALINEKIQNLSLGMPLVVSKTATLGEVLGKITSERRAYAVIVAEGHVAGIFTERDLMTRVALQHPPLTTPIEKLMTPNPTVLKGNDSMAEAIRVMNQGGHRHVPIISEQGALQGVLGVRDLIRYLAEHFPYEVYNLPPDPEQTMREPEGA